VAARNKIPSAEKAVNPLRTFGLAKIVVALPIIEIRNEYHDAEVRACTNESKKIPQPRLKS
jgi:hypothetical protein